MPKPFAATNHTQIIEPSDSLVLEQSFEETAQYNEKVLNDQPALRLTIRPDPTQSRPQSPDEIITISLPIAQMPKEHVAFFKQQSTVIFHLKPTLAEQMSSSSPTQLTLKIRPCESYKVVLSEIHIPLANLSKTQLDFFRQPATIKLQPTQGLLNYNLDSKPLSKEDLKTKEEKNARIRAILQNGADSVLQDSELSSEDVGPFSVIELFEDTKNVKPIIPKPNIKTLKTLKIGKQPKTLQKPTTKSPERKATQPCVLRQPTERDLTFVKPKNKRALAPIKFSSKLPSDKIL